MKKSTAALVSVICLLAGIILGFLIVPIKEGIGNHYANATNNHYKFSEEE